MAMIRMVTFDILHTLITPRLPVYVQYSQTFEPYLGVLDPGALKQSFKSALKQVQKEKPAYSGGSNEWWGEVIKKTAIGAGASPGDVTNSLDKIVPRLLHRFSSQEGYKLFDDSLFCLQELRRMNVKTGVISNTDQRMLAVLDDLDVSKYLDPILVSEIQGVEKPNPEIYARAGHLGGEAREVILHVGDELEADYHGARNAGLQALLLRRPGLEGEGEHKEIGEDLTNVGVIADLRSVPEMVARRNRQL